MKIAAQAAYLVLALANISAFEAIADTITASDGFNGRYTAIGGSAGLEDLILFGANAVPNGQFGTTGSYFQLDSISGSPVTGALRYPNFAVNPNVFDGAVPYSSGLQGAWTFTFQNGLDTTQYLTSALGPTAALPFAQSVSVSGSGTSPTVQWRLPGSVPALDRAEVWVWGARSGAPFDLVHVGPSLSPTTTAYQIPSVLSSGQSIEQGRNYFLSIVLHDDQTENGITRYDVSRSFTYVGYSVVPDSTVPIYLPLQGSGTGGQPVFSFLPIDVAAGKEILIDPAVAVGYDYAIKPGDPLIIGVRLPVLAGVAAYDLEYDDNGSSFLATVKGGDLFTFPGSGVSKFRVSGIPPGLGVDPSNPTAFITGLTFGTDGVFAGTMTPLTVNVPIPEPSTVALMLVGIPGLGLLVHRRRHRQQSFSG